LDALRNKPDSLIGGVDWISKKWLLDTFRESEGLTWQDPWLQSLDLEYHNINPEKGLFFALTPAKRIGEFNDSMRRPEANADCPKRHPRPRPRAGGLTFPAAEGSRLRGQLGLDLHRECHTSADAGSVRDVRESRPRASRVGRQFRDLSAKRRA
jgi:hypothetical protein